ncbi:Yip1 family protein [Bacillaceae bacterium IKA-2]|nr:Yip1 family protein [Bacillaceae bacterium IKA-2]
MLTVWFKPRATIRGLLDNPNPKFIYSIITIYGVVIVLNHLSHIGIGDDDMSLTFILLTAVFLGPIIGFIWYYLLGALFKWVGSLLGEKGSYRDLRLTLVCYAIPSVVLLGLWIISLILFGIDNFNKSSVEIPIIFFLIVGPITLLIIIWSIVILVNCFSETHKFSKKKALLLSLIYLPFYWIGL